MKKLFVSIVVAWAVAFTALYFHGLASNPQRTPVLMATAESARPAPTEKSDVLSDRLRDEVATLRAEVTRLGKELAAARSEKEKLRLASSSRAGAPMTAASMSNLMQAVQAGMAKELLPQVVGGIPGLLGMDRAQLEKMYGPFMARMGFSAAKKQAFLDALSGQPAVIRFSSGGDMVEAPENEALKKLLGDTDYAAWQQYEKSMPNREAVADFEQRLNEKGLHLTDDQREKLIAAFQQSALGQPNMVELNLGDGQDPGQSIDQAMNANYNKWDKLMSDAGGILNPEQMKALDGYLGERADQHEAMVREASRLVPPGLNSPRAGSTGSSNAAIKVISIGSMRSMSTSPVGSRTSE